MKGKKIIKLTACGLLLSIMASNSFSKNMDCIIEPGEEIAVAKMDCWTKGYGGNNDESVMKDRKKGFGQFVGTDYQGGRVTCKIFGNRSGDSFGLRKLYQVRDGQPKDFSPRNELTLVNKQQQCLNTGDARACDLSDAVGSLKSSCCRFYCNGPVGSLVNERVWYGKCGNFVKNTGYPAYRTEKQNKYQGSPRPSQGVCDDGWMGNWMKSWKNNPDFYIRQLPYDKIDDRFRNR